MWLSKVELSQFRNYQRYELVFSSPATVLVGENAVGKTNILEAVYLLATGGSFRAGKIEEMVRWEEEVGHVIGKLKAQSSTPKGGQAKLKADAEDELRVTLTRGMVQGKRVAKRRYLVNGVGRRKMDFVGNVLAVKFTPQDLQLINGSPSRRRGYLDDVLSQVDREYARSLASYEKGLRRRNKLLDLIRDGKTQPSALAFWDKLVVKEGEVLHDKRQRYIDFVNSTESFETPLHLHYQHSVITAERLVEYGQREMMAGHTLVGPHKDDIELYARDDKGKSSAEGRNLATYGSRGEQRMGVLWLKMAELAYVEKVKQVRPLLLLDDIFSELDDEHDRLVMGLMSKQQTLVTTTDVDGRFEKMADVEIVELGKR